MFKIKLSHMHTHVCDMCMCRVNSTRIVRYILFWGVRDRDRDHQAVAVILLGGGGEREEKEDCIASLSDVWWVVVVLFGVFSPTTYLLLLLLLLVAPAPDPDLYLYDEGRGMRGGGR